MARSKNNKATAAPRVAVDVASSGTRSASTVSVGLLVLSILAAVWAVAMMTAPGRVGYYYFFIYSEFYMGVISLVSLSITIMIGLVATDRLVLSIRQRVLLQSAHRTTGVIAVSALFVHVWTKFAESHIGLIDIVIPFLVQGNPLVGLGTISGWIMVLVTWSGIARAKFIGRGKPWMWRGIHAISYLIWPIALMHGLGAGRPAATWVIVSYVVCVLGVLVGLAVRLSVSLNRKKDFASPAGVGAVKPGETGTLVPTAAAPIRRPARRAEPAADLLAPAAGPAQSPAWIPAAPVSRPVSAAPDPRQMVAEEEPAPRGRREPEMEAPAPRQRRPVEDDERYDTQTRISRRDLEDDRYRYDDEPAPRARGGRSQEIYDEPPRGAGRGRRFEDDDEPVVRPRGRDDIETSGTRMRRDDMETTGARMRRFEDDEPAPRSRRREPVEYDEPIRGRRRADDEYEEAPVSARPARYEEPRYEEPRYEEPRRPSRSGFVDFAEDGPAYPADDTPTLVDSGSRRARRAEPGRGARRGRDDGDDAYFSQLRGDVRESN